MVQKPQVFDGGWGTAYRIRRAGQGRVMDYAQARAWLEQVAKQRGMVLGLDAMRALLDRLGNPQDQLHFIHIAGTNGKGSVSAFLERILICAGYHTGAYTSPAVFDFCEPYRIDGMQISKDAFAACMEKIAAAAEETERETGLHPTEFEQETALAFLWFAQNHCEPVVLETLLGGDLDATNVVTGVVCSVLTSISIDHRRVLGNTLTEIAGHKAGIMLPKVPAVSDRQAEEAAAVLAKRAKELEIPLIWADPEQMREEEEDETGMTVSYREWQHLRVGQRALWQLRNLAVVLETVGVLRKQGYRIPDQAVRDGVEQMYWPGRFEVIPEAKLMDGSAAVRLVLDGAHNPGGAKALRESLDHCFPRERRVFVMGVLADKDYRTVIRTLLPGVSNAIAIASDSPRALPAEQLADAIREEFPRMSVCAADSVREALKKAVLDAGTDGIIVVCGSLSFLKDVRAALV